MSKAGVPPDMLAKTLQLQKALADQGVPVEMIAQAMEELFGEAGSVLIPEMKDLLQGGISPDDINKILALSKSFSSGAEGKSKLDIPGKLASKEDIKVVYIYFLSKKLCGFLLQEFLEQKST